MAFGLPPAWRSGFALPDNVLDEGLERRAFVTKQMPRGTYDNTPPDPTGGFAVPGYVRQEGYGQGAYTTKWMPRGEYGPRVPQWIQKQPTVAAMRKVGDAKVVTIQRRQFSGLGGLSGEPPLPGPFEEYGARAASAILRRINQLAPSERKKQLKQIMDAIDPSLWNRTAEITRRYVGQGLTAVEAFPRGLARALAAGIAAEMIAAGKSRVAPQPRSLLGLGCYGCDAALGALPLVSTAVLAPTVGKPVLVATKVPAGKQVQVGPFTFPVGDQPFVLANGAAAIKALPREWHGYISRALKISDAEQQALIQDVLKKIANSAGTASGSTAAAVKVFNMQMAKSPDNAIWKDALHIFPGQNVTLRAISPMMTTGKWSDSDDGRAMPIATFTHPVSGNKWGVFLGMSGDKLNPTGVQLYVKWLPEQPWYTRALGWIASLPAKLIEAVKEVVEELGDLACQLASNPNAINAGAAAGVAAGGGAAAGAAGAAIAQSLCGGPKTAAPPPPPPSQDNLLPVVLIGGGVLAAALLLTKKKKAT